MDEEPPNFCTSCGAPLRESDTFCTTCGASVSGHSSTAPPYARYESPKPKDKRLLIMAILSAVWAVFAIWQGLEGVLAAESAVSGLESSPEFDFIFELFTHNELVSLIVAVSAVILASGILAAVTAILAGTKRFYTVALVACIFSAALGLIAIVGFVGFIVAYFIHTRKYEFAGQT